MDSRGSGAGAPDEAATESDTAQAHSDPARALGPQRAGPRTQADRDVAPVPARPGSVATDQWPDAESLPWASEEAVPAPHPPARQPGRRWSPAARRGDDTTEIIRPDQVVPPPHRGAGAAVAPGRASPSHGPRPGAEQGLGTPAPTAWAPPAGPPYAPGSPAGPPDAPATGASPPPRHARRHGGRDGPGLAGVLGDAARRLQGWEPVVFTAVGVVLVLVAVAIVGRGGGGGGSGATDRAAPPTTAPVAGGDGTDPTGPFVGPSGIVGWWSGTDWVPRAQGDVPEGGVVLTVAGVAGELRTADGTIVTEDCAAPGDARGPDVRVDLGGEGGAPPPIGVAGVGEPRPQPVEQLPTTMPIYRQAAADVARRLGATTPPTLVQVLRSDLDGSGTYEVVVAAEHLPDPDAPAAGDWSVVFLRRVVGDGVATDVLASSPGGAGGFDRVRVSALADLNADGTMELVLDGRSEGGQWTAVHEVGADGTPREVLRDGCPG